jgi:hypothetical protein
MFTGNKYVLVTIDHYFKWCQMRLVEEHDVGIVAKFLEEKIICCFGMPNYIFIDNGSEWMKSLMFFIRTMELLIHYTSMAIVQ